MILRFFFLLMLAFSYSIGANDGVWTADARTIVQEKGKNLKIGILCAHPNELGSLAEKMEGSLASERGMRKYVQGKLWGIDTVIVVSRVGKVAAGCTTASLITEHGVDLILFTGVAGAADETLGMGDCVIASGLIQHDMDSSPIIPAFTIPFLRVKTFCPDKFLQEKAFAAATLFLNQQLSELVSTATLETLKVQHPKVVYGCIASGDKFFADKVALAALKQKLPEICCVEMEGAAVAQVCYEYAIPCVIIRTISDLATANAGVDCLQFMKQVSPIYTENILKNIYSSIKQ